MSFLADLRPDPWGLLLLLPAGVSFLLALEAARVRYRPNGVPFALLMGAISWWSLTYGLELCASLHHTLLFWLRAEYLVIPFVPVLMARVVRGIVGKGPFRGRWGLYLALPAVLTLALQWTNGNHGLYYRSVEAVLVEGTPRLSLSPGPWYLVQQAYAFALGAYALLLLSGCLRTFPSPAQPQCRLALAAVALPYAAFLVSFFGWFPVPHLDLTPFAFAVSGALMSVAVFRFRMLDLSPVGRDRVFATMDDGAIVLDAVGRVIDANPSALRLFGWPTLPFGRTLDEVQQEFPDGLTVTATSNGRWTRLHRIGDEDRHFTVRHREIFDPRGREVGALLLFHDLTERYRTEQELRRINAEKDRLFSIIGHDLRAPVASLVAAIEILRDQEMGLTPDERESMLGVLGDSAGAALALLENLLTWARLQQEQMEPVAEPLWLHEIVGNVVRQFEAAKLRKGLEIVVDLDEEVTVLADRNLLELALRNLLSNAVKFTGKGGRVEVVSRSPAVDLLEMRVSDNGIGIPPEILGEIWSITSRVGRAGTDGEASSGLGLVLCREAVERNGGRIEVSSEVGKGTTFRFTIPVLPRDPGGGETRREIESA